MITRERESEREGESGEDKTKKWKNRASMPKKIRRF